MPPRKQASSKKGAASKEAAAPPIIDAGSSFTPDNFEAELKKLAEQAKGETWANWGLEQVRAYGKAASLLAAAGVYANVSQLALSPVYGGIPASMYHNKVVVAACFAGWSANLALRRATAGRTARLLPLIAIYIPLAQFYLFQLSGALAARWGPVVTEVLTLFPLLAVSVACVADTLEAADFSGLPKWAAECAPGLGSWWLYKFFNMLSAEYLAGHAGQSFAQTRMGLELVLAGTYAAMAPSTTLLLLGVPAALHAAFLNTHVMTPLATARLNATLQDRGWTLLDRRESLTGYVSILDSQNDGFRVMRCDHSLLGGEWTKLPKTIVGEPIYSVFTMLEAVRLVENPDKLPDHEAKALNIGLGIGTAAGALINHGIDTTVVEIDPAVYDFAVKHFALPANHTAVVEDAVGYTARVADADAAKYDYILHDVFTGGAEPIPLFTLEFLQSLHVLLKPNGIIAINYAGDFLLPPLSTVVRTVRQVFPTCRIFRESPAPSDRDSSSYSSSPDGGGDFDNMVMFCRKAADGGPITFRPAVERDFLESRSRRAFLVPRHEVPDDVFLTGDDVGVVTRNDTKWLGRWHAETGLGHWGVMRHVLPEFVWENW